MTFLLDFRHKSNKCFKHQGKATQDMDIKINIYYDWYFIIQLFQYINFIFQLFVGIRDIVNMCKIGCTMNCLSVLIFNAESYRNRLQYLCIENISSLDPPLQLKKLFLRIFFTSRISLAEIIFFVKTIIVSRFTFYMLPRMWSLRHTAFLDIIELSFLFTFIVKNI